jgi:hypothetical protein
VGYHKDPIALLDIAKVRAWAASQDADAIVGQAQNKWRNPFATYLGKADPYRIHWVDTQQIMAGVCGGNCDQLFDTPSWMVAVLVEMDSHMAPGEYIKGAQLLSYLDGYLRKAENECAEIH